MLEKPTNLQKDALDFRNKPGRLIRFGSIIFDLTLLSVCLLYQFYLLTGWFF